MRRALSILAVLLFAWTWLRRSSPFPRFSTTRSQTLVRGNGAARLFEFAPNGRFIRTVLGLDCR